MTSIADQILNFNRQLTFPAKLPRHLDVINPFHGEGSDEVWACNEVFYRKFYSDSKDRVLILGINPGRHGAGTTGIPFTDTKRLEQICHIEQSNAHTHEPSSVFIYDLIDAMGGPEHFYSKFLIGSLCPLGFLTLNKKGNWVNYNFYDDKALTRKTIPLIRQNLNFLKTLSSSYDTVYLLGQGKNYKFFKTFNEDETYFRRIVPLAHPRYIMQYKLKQKNDFLQTYIDELKVYF